jgi:uncharacterized protein (DUF362 family)/Pyruvate/2-oxoacid:ferredoxin oxidoreductase delta subunit
VSVRPVVAHVGDEPLTGATPAAKVAWALDLIGGIASIVGRGDSVLIKPNLVAPFAKAATDLGVLDALIKAVRGAGGEPFIAESAGFEFDTAATFELLGLDQWAREREVRLLNLDAGPFRTVIGRQGVFRGRPFQIAECALDADVIINAPKLKFHNYTRVTLGLKNLMGLLSRESRRMLHVRGLAAGIAALADLVRPQLTVLDALTVTMRAVYGDQEPLGAIVASRDACALSHYACGLLGVDPNSIAHLRLALDASLGSAEYEVVGQHVGKPSGLPSSGARSGPAYRALFRGMYVVDTAYSRLRPGRTLIPTVHWWLGVRPHIDAGRCTRCGNCAPICVMDAIDVARARIEASRCMRLRCLRCVGACPERAIQLRGPRRPKGDAS